MAIKLDYKTGDTALSGKSIDYIFGHSPDVIVYRDPTGTVYWELGDDVMTDAGLIAHQCYERLGTRLEACLPKKRHRFFHDGLARCLFLGLCEQTPAAALAHFDHVASEIRQEALDQARVNYVLYSSVVAVFVLAVSLGALVLPLEAKFRLFAVAGAAGAAGAWASVLQRVSKLELGAFDNPAYQMMQGVTRIVLGTLFGFVSLLGIRAGILLSAAASNSSAIALIAFLGGFSERFIPELLDSMEKGQGDRPK
jgi:hypothetical protein